MCALGFRRDGLAVAAYSRLSNYVYVWTLQPAWAARMSAAPPARSALSALLAGGAPASPPRPAHLAPFRVMSAPPLDTAAAAAVDGPSPPPAASGNAGELAYALEWADGGDAVVLKCEGRVLGSIAVQCP
jgi:hypothetical protein